VPHSAAAARREADDLARLFACIFRADLIDSDHTMRGTRPFNDLRQGITYRESGRDFVSRDLLPHILASEEEHADFIDLRFDLANRHRLGSWPGRTTVHSSVSRVWPGRHEAHSSARR
jgi:hypothetical protein